MFFGSPTRMKIESDHLKFVEETYDEDQLVFIVQREMNMMRSEWCNPFLGSSLTLDETRVP